MFYIPQKSLSTFWKGNNLPTFVSYLGQKTKVVGKVWVSDHKILVLSPLTVSDMIHSIAIKKNRGQGSWQDLLAFSVTVKQKVGANLSIQTL